MGSSMLPIRPVLLRAGTDDRKPEPRKSKSETKWWAPLFGFSSEADYINTDDTKLIKPETKPVKNRFQPGSFTEEKARRFRRMTADTTSSHDMYHSAIASRLATDFSDDDSD